MEITVLIFLLASLITALVLVLGWELSGRWDFLSSRTRCIPVIRDAAVSVLAPGGVVGSTVRIRVTTHIPLLVPGGDAFGLGRLTTVSAESTFRQEGWKP